MEYCRESNLNRNDVVSLFHSLRDRTIIFALKECNLIKENLLDQQKFQFRVRMKFFQKIQLVVTGKGVCFSL